MKNEKLQKYEIHEKFKMSAYFISEKKKPLKIHNFFNFLPYISKGHHFSITKLEILIICNILQLEMDF